MLDVETLLLAVLAFMAGLVGAMMISGRFRRVDGAGPVSEYRRRMGEYEGMLLDLLIRMDTLEMRSGQGASPAAQGISHPSGTSHTARDIGHMPVVAIARTAGQQKANGMVDCVLKLLAQEPRTSKKIEAVIGRTREHTARLMKRLFEKGYVTRDSTSKPYTYSITEAGRAMMLQQQPQQPQEQQQQMITEESSA